MHDSRNLRRGIAAAVCLVVVGVVLAVIPRVGLPSPVAIVALCVLAVLTMKLVEHRIHRWFQRWESRQAARTAPPERPPGAGGWNSGLPR